MHTKNSKNCHNSMKKCMFIPTAITFIKSKSGFSEIIMFFAFLGLKKYHFCAIFKAIINICAQRKV